MKQEKKSKRIAAAQKAIRDYPKAGARTIAKALFDGAPSLWGSVESARSTIRYLSGQLGEHKPANQQNVRAPRKPGYTELLPMSRKNNNPPVKIGPGSILILSDLHIPYHDLPSLKAALHYGADHVKPETIVLLGDIIDCYQVSAWDRRPSRVGIKGELESLNLFFQTLCNMFPESRILWKEGNHEERMNRYILTNAPALWDVKGVNLREMSGAEGYGIEYINERRRIDAGRLSMYHGHELQGRASVNPARSQFVQTCISTIAGHCHRTSTHLESDDNGKLIGSWSMGCLCDMRPEYAPINKWNHGFGVAHIRTDGSFNVENKIIIDGEVV